MLSGAVRKEIQQAMFQYITPHLEIQGTYPIKQESISTELDSKIGQIRENLKSNVHQIGASLSDNGASGFYRIRFVSRILEQIFSINVQSLDLPILAYPNLLEKFDSIRIQRANESKHIPWLRHYFLPVKRNKPGLKLIYDADDCLILQDFPRYNNTKQYLDLNFGVIHEFMECSTYITVSTERLKEYYVKRCRINPDKVIVRPNRLPKFFSSAYTRSDTFDRLRKLKDRKPRICFACTPTHIDHKNLNNGIDDFSGINEWIIENRKRYQFVFLTELPQALRPYAEDFEVHKTVPFLEYVMKRLEIRADLYVQPLQRNIFNECKSPIKLLEAWAIGVPSFVQDLGVYKELSPESCFADANELDRMVQNLFAQPIEQTAAQIQANYDRLEPIWLENTYEEWLPILFNG